MFLDIFDIIFYKELKYKIKYKIKLSKNWMLIMCHELCWKPQDTKVKEESLFSVEQLLIACSDKRAHNFSFTQFIHS